MSDKPKIRTWMWVGLAVACTATAAGAGWVIFNGQSSLEDDLASGDVDKMRVALTTADPDLLGSKDARATRDLTIEAMKKMPIEDLMALWQGDDLTDEQRDALAKNLRAIWMNHIGELAEEYFLAAPDEKERMLDKQIDEWTVFMDRMREYREARKDDPEAQEQREEQRRRWRNPSKEDKKDRMANMNPDRQMKMFHMFTKMRERAKERGLDMGWGPRGGRDRGQSEKDGRDRNRDRDRDRGQDDG